MYGIFTLGILNFGTSDILGEIIFCHRGGSAVQHGVFSSIPGFYLLGASSRCAPTYDKQKCPQTLKNVLGGGDSGTCVCVYVCKIIPIKITGLDFFPNG